MNKIKSLLVLSVFSLFTLGTEAKTANLSSKQEKAKKRFQSYLAQNQAEFAAKKKRSASRLMATTYSSYNGTNLTLIDSTHYNYNSNIGYDPTFDIFDELGIDSYLYGTQSERFDKSYRWDMASTPAMIDSTTNLFTTGHKLAYTKFDDFNNGGFSSTSQAYNASGKKIQTIDTFNFSSLQVYKADFTLNAQNKVIAIANTENGVYTSIDSLYYDVEGKLIKVQEFDDAGDPVFKNEISYNAQALIGELIFSDWNGSSWDFSDKTTIIYNAGNHRLATYYSLYNAGNWVFDSKDTLMYTTSVNYPTTQIYSTYDDVTSTWSEYQKLTYTYNALDQITSQYSMYWNGSAYDPSYKYEYFYELYSPASTTTLTSSNDFQVYPNPTQGQLNIKTSGDVGQVQVRILSMQGQLVQQATIPSNQQVMPLSTQSLEAGNYFVELISTKGSSVFRFTKM